VALSRRLLIAPAVVMMLASFAGAAYARQPDSPKTLGRSGTAAIENRRFGDALAAFTRAAALQPGDATFCFGAGVAAFMLGQNEVARSRFECALATNPDYLQATLWLGDLHYRAGRLDEAIAVYESAQERAPSAGELQEQLVVWRKEQELQRRFQEVRSPHFTALFEASTDEPLARLAVARLEAAYERVGVALGVYPPQPIVVVLYTRDQFGSITRLADWSAAAYDGRIRVRLGGALQERDELDRVLSHEFVHAVVAMLGGRTVPAWMNEGLATVLEPAGSSDAEAPLLEAKERPGLSSLHGSFGGFSRRDAEIAYASSARAVRRLLERHGAPALVALLKDLGRGESFASAFRERLAIRYEDFAALAVRD
jgi:tetratricopeptide (TPR) repeat protein